MCGYDNHCKRCGIDFKTYGVKSDYCQDCEETIYENAIKSGITYDEIYYNWVDIYKEDTYYASPSRQCVKE